MEKRIINTEKWRVYDFGGRIYRIKDPQYLFFREGGTTHRIVDNNNIVHCCPAPGYMGCVVRWKSKDVNKPVAF